MTAVTRAADGTVTGNTYDKYGTRNPVARALQRGFERNLDDLFASVEPRSLLDVGCGEGVLTQRWARELEPRRVVGIDLDDPLIAAEWERHGAPNLTYIAQRAERLPFADGEFDLVTAIEVLEHVPDPAHTVAEMARCAQRHVLVSVPREPLWRAVNMARGAYWRDARQHARPRQPLLEGRDRRALRAPRRGDRDALAVPLDDGACPGLSAAGAPTGAARACCRSGSPRPAS